ncbi:hypothetical protein Mal15_41790 [Stieleria maiorica]|uniref:Uncharacterized protein n=1 Tax=Stieleria maiorica TaxID=2795974 RepID=A0A5B9MHY4_9BACT|nr:hypothetical protein [Stieleria maiorica]QEG00110.1 hypothetical protein Mal15_41790 [Stieleria maiorica]
MEWSDSLHKTYEVKQIDGDGAVLDSFPVDAKSGEAAAKELENIAAGTEKIAVCLDGDPINEMGVDYWIKRVRRR